MNIIYFWFFTLWTAHSMHNIHVGVIEINMSEDRTDITVKTFLDDLQIAVGLTPGSEIPIGYTSADEMIEQYVRNHLILVHDKDTVTYRLEDSSAAQDAVWLTFKSNVALNTGNLILHCDFMTEIYPDQKNIVLFTGENTKEYFTLDLKRNEAVVDIKKE